VIYLSLNDEIKQALSKQPNWVLERAITNIEKYIEKKLITKYDSKDIEELKEDDIINTNHFNEIEKNELKKLGINHLKNSNFAYFTMAGGISTSMGGCSKAILEAKENKTFLEIKLNHIRYIQKKYNCKIPFILMTNEETDLSITTFLSKENRLNEIDLIKIIQPITIRFEEINNEIKVAKLKNGDVSYAPGGHYDAFILLNEIKEQLKKLEIKTIYVTNIDNLGATIDPLLLGTHLKEKSFFTPEIAKKEIDDKGGTFAKILNNLKLLEGPMVPEDYKEKFNDVNINKYFNTNLIYLNIDLFDDFDEINNEIPTFINKKIIDNKPMFGFEAAIGLIFGLKKSKLLLVKREKRFLPIKFLSDLWLLRSNFMLLDKETWAVYQEKNKKPTMIISDKFISNLDDFNEKIADGGKTTNFKDLISLKWNAKEGKVGSNVTFKGNIIVNEENCIIDDNKIIIN
jgi:UTP--glucose-1-phosphate uridylyltransferase